MFLPERCVNKLSASTVVPNDAHSGATVIKCHGRSCSGHGRALALHVQLATFYYHLVPLSFYTHKVCFDERWMFHSNITSTRHSRGHHKVICALGKFTSLHPRLSTAALNSTRSRWARFPAL